MARSRKQAARRSGDRATEGRPRMARMNADLASHEQKEAKVAKQEAFDQILSLLPLLTSVYFHSFVQAE
jgi:hypothetical protein